jgi:hypothetical protein
MRTSANFDERSFWTQPIVQQSVKNCIVRKDGQRVEQRSEQFSMSWRV